MSKIVILLFLFFKIFPCNGQDENKLILFTQKISEAKNDEQKIEALGELADYYSLFKLNAKADSILTYELSVAESSNNNELVIKSLFSSNISMFNSWNSKDAFLLITNFIKKSIDYFQNIQRNDFLALAYTRLASIFRKRAMYDEALEEITLGFTTLNDIEADSIKCDLYIELGDIFLGKGDAVSAYKNYNNAISIAYKSKTISLQSEIYHHLSELYKSLGNSEMSKKVLQESMDLDIKNNYTIGLLSDYIDLGRLTDDTIYANKAFRLATNVSSDRYIEYSKRLTFAWYMVKGHNTENTLRYFINNPSLGQFFRNQGSANSQWNMGNIYFYGGKFDSALHYYKLAEDELNKNYEDGIRLSILRSIADTYIHNNIYELAKNYYNRAFEICKKINDIKSLPIISDSLSKIYESQSNYQQALYFNKVSDSCNNLLEEKSAKDKVALLQVERENQKRESDQLEIAQQKQRKDNLQIMAIIILLAGAFLAMLFLGMFSVSKITIRLFGYFAFISLFEFVVLLSDPLIIKLTDAEPLKIWGIKIVLIALLVPCQHFLEHNLIKFLSSRKLIEARQKLSLKIRKQEKENKSPDSEEDIETDTAIL